MQTALALAAMGRRAPSGDWWQDTTGQWHEGGRPEPLPASMAPFESVPSAPPRPSTKRKGFAIVALWLLAPTAVLSTATVTSATSVDNSSGVGLIAIAVLSCPMALAFRGAQWNASRVVGIVGGFSLASNAVLCLLLISVGASPAGPIDFGLLLSFLAGAAALVVLITASPRLVVAFESLAAIGTAAALTVIALHSAELHHVEVGSATTTTTSVEDWSSLYVAWAVGGAMFVAGAILAVRPGKR
jgi:hypothetical protein